MLSLSEKTVEWQDGSFKRPSCRDQNTVPSRQPRDDQHPGQRHGGSSGMALESGERPPTEPTEYMHEWSSIAARVSATGKAGRLGRPASTGGLRWTVGRRERSPWHHRTGRSSVSLSGLGSAYDPWSGWLIFTASSGVRSGVRSAGICLRPGRDCHREMISVETGVLSAAAPNVYTRRPSSAN
jgi:hypothetical protein